MERVKNLKIATVPPSSGFKPSSKHSDKCRFTSTWQQKANWCEKCFTFRVKITALLGCNLKLVLKNTLTLQNSEGYIENYLNFPDSPLKHHSKLIRRNTYNLKFIMAILNGSIKSWVGSWKDFLAKVLMNTIYC